MMWLKIALVVSLLGGAYGVVKMYNDNAKALGACESTSLTQVGALFSKDAEIARLNGRIRANNDRQLAELAKAEAQAEIANAAAEQARHDRQAAQEEVRHAQERYRQLLANDPELQAYSRAPGWPDAVRNRLRVANGEIVRDQ